MVDVRNIELETIFFAQDLHTSGKLYGDASMGPLCSLKGLRSRLYIGLTCVSLLFRKTHNLWLRPYIERSGISR